MRRRRHSRLDLIDENGLEGAECLVPFTVTRPQSLAQLKHARNLQQPQLGQRQIHLEQIPVRNRARSTAYLRRRDSAARHAFGPPETSPAAPAPAALMRPLMRSERVGDLTERSPDRPLILHQHAPLPPAAHSGFNRPPAKTGCVTCGTKFYARWPQKRLESCVSCSPGNPPQAHLRKTRDLRRDQTLFDCANIRPHGLQTGPQHGWSPRLCGR